MIIVYCYDIQSYCGTLLVLARISEINRVFPSTIRTSLLLSAPALAILHFIANQLTVLSVATVIARVNHSYALSNLVHVTHDLSICNRY